MTAGRSKPESRVWSPRRCHRINLSELLLRGLNEGPGGFMLQFAGQAR